jgi:hypothetical protein
MNPSDHSERLLEFFKLLGEPKRLKIVGLLAERPRTVEQLSTILGISLSTVSHHLSLLADASLVTARPESYYRVYRLNAQVLSGMAKSLLRQSERASKLAAGKTDAFDRRVIEAFMTEDGRIKAFPAQEKKFLVLIRHVLQAFEPGVQYTEKRVNQILARFNEDTARLRRALVDHRFMMREGGGGKYWRID